MEHNDISQALDYNTSRERLAMPEYGRNVLRMVDQLREIPDRAKRTEQAYAIVQRNSMQVWDDVQQAREGLDLRGRLEADPECTLTAEQLDAIFDPWSFLGRIDAVFERLEDLSFDE